jgi:hypothetical protein
MATAQSTNDEDRRIDSIGRAFDRLVLGAERAERIDRVGRYLDEAARLGPLVDEAVRKLRVAGK